MRFDPFLIKSAGGDIKDRRLPNEALTVDGDIVVADSYRKHPRHHWAKFQKSALVFYLAALTFVGLAGRLYYLQIVRGADYYGAAEDNRFREQILPAPRGVIFDSNGAKLAYNVPDFALYVVPADLPKSQDEEDKIFAEIGAITGKSAFDLVETFARVPRESFLPIEIKRSLSQEQAVVLERKSSAWSGIVVRAVEQRTYVAPAALSHLLGYTGKISEAEFTELKNKGYLLTDFTGKTGVEKTYESRLRGRAGREFVEVDALGKPKETKNELPPQSGANLYLNIDLGLQELAAQELTNVSKAVRAPGGAVIALDPRNGAVRALVSVPGFDANLFSRGIDAKNYQALLDDPAKPLYNRALLGEYPSGSTFKLIVAAGALAEKLVDENFTVLSTGGLWVNGYHFPDWKAGGHGRTNITKAIAESVNTFFYTIGGGWPARNASRSDAGGGDFTGLGMEKIVDYGKLFGLTEPTGIDLPSENSGFLPTKEWKEKAKGERWFLGDTYHLAIGQGDILVTPLQVANYTAAIANGGTLYRPRIGAKFALPDGSSEEIKPTVIRHLDLDPETTKTVARGMRQTAVSGSAASLSTLGVPVAGKTGTAESVSGVKPHAWFTGFAPYPEAEIVITVLVEGGEGGAVSATPIAKKLFEYYFSKKRPE